MTLEFKEQQLQVRLTYDGATHEIAKALTARLVSSEVRKRLGGATPRVIHPGGRELVVEATLTGPAPYEILKREVLEVARSVAEAQRQPVMAR